MSKSFKMTVLATSLAAAISMSSAFAADKINGSVAGQVAAQSGQNLANVEVEIKHNSKGLVRTTSTDESGKFNLKSLPIGQYTIRFIKNGYQTIEQAQLSVLAGNKATFDINMNLAGVETISVTGQMIQRIDMSSSTSALSFDAAQLEALPIAQDSTSIALLTPGTSLAADGDNDYGRGASFNGSSVAENGVFLNGLNITDIRKGLGNIDFPWEAIGQASVISGGVPAEYGNYIGGITDYVSKSGSNEFKFGAKVDSRLGDLLAGQDPTTYKFDDGQPNGDGTYPTVLDTNNTEDYYSKRKINVWASGAIIEDTLFFYALLNPQQSTSRWGAGSNSISQKRSEADYWFGKIDWFINDNHNIGFTALNNEWETRQSNASYEFNDGSGKRTGEYGDPAVSSTGGSLWSVNYSGILTDELTVSAVYGVTKQDESSVNPKAEQSPAWDIRDGTWNRVGDWADYYASAVAENEREQLRVDFDYELGDHTLRFGYSSEKVTTYDDRSYAGNGTYYKYWTASAGDESSFNENLEKQALRKGETFTPISIAGQEYVEARTYTKKGSTESNYVSFYAEDSWSVTDSLTLNLGLRNSKFDSLTGTGETYVEMKNQWAPRLGATYDLFGDGTTKLFANYGRYFMPISPNTSARMVLPETNIYQYGTFTGINENNQATGVENFYTDISSDGELAQPVSTYVDKDLDPMYSDEIAFGVTHELNDDWVVGAKFTYQNLKSSIEDTNLVYALVQKWGKENPDELAKLERLGLNTNVNWLALVVNPGNDIKLAYDINEDGTVADDEFVKWDADYLGLPQAQRKYRALELTLQGRPNERSTIQASYTFSRSEGNTEGLVSGVHSQADPGWSGSFDAPELTDNSYGLTSNDIPHKFKVFGNYQITDSLDLGFFASAQSGRPINKLGYHPQGVGSCAVQPAVTDCSDIRGTDFYYDGKDSTRGSYGHSDWIYNLDLKLSYAVDVGYGDLKLSANVYNVFNSHTALTYNDAAELEQGVDSPNYRNPTSFQMPRYVSLNARYEF